MRRLLAAGALAALAVTAASCIDDLDAPTACPAAPKHVATSCLDALQKPTLGCLTYDQTGETPDRVACLAGPRDSCRCTSADCPPVEGACYPDGDCPGAVTEEFANASCQRLLPEDIGADLPTTSMCMCMCAGCAAVCDGVGPVVGTYTSEDFQPNPILFEFGDRMPQKGRLGLYLRTRGLASVRVVLFKGDTGDLGNLDYIQDPVYFTVSELGTEFVDQVLFTDTFLDVHAYTWTRAEDKPTAAAILPTVSDKEPSLALFELDCLVPFVVPL